MNIKPQINRKLENANEGWGDFSFLFDYWLLIKYRRIDLQYGFNRREIKFYVIVGFICMLSWKGAEGLDASFDTMLIRRQQQRDHTNAI